MEIFAQLQEEMLPSLVQRYEDANNRPDLVVVDRFTFAEIGRASCRERVL